MLYNGNMNWIDLMNETNKKKYDSLEVGQKVFLVKDFTYYYENSSEFQDIPDIIETEILKKPIWDLSHLNNNSSNLTIELYDKKNKFNYFIEVGDIGIYAFSTKEEAILAQLELVEDNIKIANKKLEQFLDAKTRLEGQLK